MSTHKHIEKICCVAIILALLTTVLFMHGESLGLQKASHVMGYETRLFDTNRVHTIDIVMDDWDEFLETCENEEYAMCSVVIDGDACKNIGIRAKGNTSLSNVSQIDSDRYSFKLEFDHYDSTKTYHGLDKLSLNNLIQDNTMMKDYLVYQMMNEFGVDAPLCSFVYITVNGEDWGLYLAVEGVEDSFLQRNYGKESGELYKPDSMSFGGGRGNGKDFEMGDFNVEDFNTQNFSPENFAPNALPGGNNMGGRDSIENGESMHGFGGMADFDSRSSFGGMGSSDVKLQYIDDNPDSYSNIFDNAKTDINSNDRSRLIESLKTLSSGENIEDVVAIEEVIRYFVVHNFVVNGDSYTGSMVHNYYLYEQDGLLSMIPWDYNLAFGTFSGGSATSAVNDPIDSPVSGGSMDDRPMIAWIFENEEYTNMYHQYFAEFLATCFASGYFTELLDSTVDLIAPYVEKDPGKFCTYEEFETGVATIREFCLLRADSVNGQLNGSIPATSDAQNANPGSLIDASTLTLSDMGAMGGNMGGGFGGGFSDGFGDGFDGGTFDEPFNGERPTQPPTTGNSGEMNMPPGMDNSDEMNMPSNMNSFDNTNIPATPVSDAAIPLTVISVVLLLIGIVAVAKYKR